MDHLPVSAGRISRLLFSRPDWDDALVAGQGARRVLTGRGPVKAGSFPSDDTHLMILTIARGQRLRLEVVPSDTEETEARARIEAVDDPMAAGGAGRAWDIWDDEKPST